MHRSHPWTITSAAVVVLLGITVYAAVPTTIAVGEMGHSEWAGGPATVTVRTLEVVPGEVTGWHYHTGLGALNVVKQGTLVIEDACGGETVYSAGDAFLEPSNRVHRGKNLHTSEAVITAQTFVVAVGAGLAVNTGQLCGQPASVSECRKGGWMAFQHPREFSSQGDCEQFAIARK